EQRAGKRIAALPRVKARGFAERDRKPDVFGSVSRLHVGDLLEHERLGVVPVAASDANAYELFALAIAFAAFDERRIGKAEVARSQDVMLGERIAAGIFVKLCHAQVNRA